MEEALDENKVAQLCKFMRIIDVFDKNESEIKDYTEIVESVQELRERVKTIMDLLSDEQKDYVLEVHKRQAEYLAEEMEKAQKKANNK